MKGFTYENQGSETLLVYHLGEDEHLDSLAKGMLQENEITGILRPSFIQRDADQYLKFPVTSRIPLKDFLQGEIDRSSVLKLCLSVTGAVQEIEAYMLETEKLLLDVRYIFVDIRRKEAGLIYLPVDEFSFKLSVKEFLLGMLSHMRYQLDEDLSYVAKLIGFINQAKSWGYEDLQRYIQNLINEQEKSPQKMDDGQVAPLEQLIPDREIFAADNQEKQVFMEIAGTMEEAAPSIPGSDNIAYSQVEIPPMEKELEVPAKKRLFGGKKKEPKKVKAEKKKDVPLPNVEIPGMNDIPVRIPAEHMPQIEIPGIYQQEEKKKSGLFSFGKKKKDLEIAEAVVPPIPEIVGSRGTPAQMPVFNQSTSPARQPQVSQPQSVPVCRQAPEGATVYMGHGSSEDKNRTVIMGGGRDYGSTVILGQGENPSKADVNRVVRLIRRRTGQGMVINKKIFRIGSEAGFVDFYIGDNRAIGSCHADIFEDSGAYYITDKNSVNHTYVNRIMVQPMQSVQLASGVVITLADEDFDFIIT